MEKIIGVLADHPAWFINDMIVVILSVATVIFIVKKEERPVPILLEAAGFVFLYSVIFDNIAINYMHLYTYGRSILMFGGVILSMPLTEWMILYYCLRMFRKAKIPLLLQPFLLGFFGFLQDLSLDPVAIRQVTGAQGRWTWHMGAGWSQHLGIPIYNYLGWFLMPMCAAIMFMIGRYLYRKSNYKAVIGYIYPLLGSLLGLALLFSPISKFIMYASVTTGIGAPVEWYTLAFWSAIGITSLIVWRFRMKEPLRFRDDWVILVIPAALHIADVVGALILRENAVTMLVLAASAVHVLIVCGAFFLGKTVPANPKKAMS